MVARRPQLVLVEHEKGCVHALRRNSVQLAALFVQLDEMNGVGPSSERDCSIKQDYCIGRDYRHQAFGIFSLHSAFYDASNCQGAGTVDDADIFA